jgi:chemotaxis protein histidine kinase CheA
MQNLILEYALCGDIKNPEGLENEYTAALYRCIPYIDTAIYDEDVYVRYNSTNKILLILWPFIKETIDEMNEAADKSADADDSALQELLEQLQESMNGAVPTGRNKPSEERGEKPPDKEELESSAGRKKRIFPAPTENTEESEETKKSEETPAETSTETEEENGEETSTTPSCTESDNADDPTETEDASDSSGASDNAEPAEAEENGENTDASESAASGSESEEEITPSEEGVPDTDEPQEVENHEGGRIPLMETDDFDTEGDGGVEQNREYEGSGYESAATDIHRMLEEMAQGRVDEALETEMHEELQGLADEIRYGNAHRGVKVRINRMVYVDDLFVENYNEIASPLMLLSKCLQRQVAQILKDRREGGKLTGLLFGKRFSARDSVRNDGRQFYNTRLPSEPMELAVAILNDESGSMGCDDRATVARAASIVLYDFCRGLNIPVAIYGHTTSSHRNDVEIYAHAEFDSVDNRDRYRLMDISARNCNRDGAALRFTAERLMKRSEPLKLLFLISDGQPHDGSGYHGTAAEADLRRIKQEYTRKGIKMFAAAIGDDKPNIERIYGDGFLDITNLNKLPQNLCTLLSRYIKAM